MIAFKERIKMHYLDNAATTPVLPQCISLVQGILQNCFANPSSLYGLGVQAEEELNNNRKIMADLLGCSASEVVFTASGTEANNIAILGAARARNKWGKTIVTTGYEHPSVLKPLSLLSQEGFEIIYVNPSEQGLVNMAELLENVDETTALVSIMQVNNETGAFIDVVELATKVKEINPRTVVHVDAAQGFGKIILPPLEETQIDSYALSGHKIHAPKGVGALYVRKGLHLIPPEQGGGQEHGLRAGTENIAYIAALSLAAQTAIANIHVSQEKVNQLLNQLLDGLSHIAGVEVFINSPQIHYEGILNISLRGLKAETVLHFLEQKEVYISTGSACAKGHASQTLLSMGIGQNRVDSALRISIDAYNTQQDIIALLEGIQQASQQLARVIDN